MGGIENDPYRPAFAGGYDFRDQNKVRVAQRKVRIRDVRSGHNVAGKAIGTVRQTVAIRIAAKIARIPACQNKGLQCGLFCRRNMMRKARRRKGDRDHCQQE